MGDSAFNANQVISGTYGSLWVNENELANVISFKAEKKAKYEDVDAAQVLGQPRKFLGYEITGTMTLNKVDSFFAKLLDDAWNEGKTPDVKIIARTADPAAQGREGVSLADVTFDALPLLDFEVKKAGKEEMAFAAVSSKYIDLI